MNISGRPFAQMSQVVLVHPSKKFKIPARQIIYKCDLFGDNPSLTASPYNVESEVSLEIFEEFVAAIQGNPITITKDNFEGLTALCQEFRFSDLDSALSEFHVSDDSGEGESGTDPEARKRIVALEKRLQKQETTTQAVLKRLSKLEAGLSALKGGPSSARSKSPGPVRKSASGPPAKTIRKSASRF
jgi:hypothetical protein